MKKTWEVLTLAAVMIAALPAQTLTTLVNFNGANGDTPKFGGLTLGADGNFYGTTYNGGANNNGTIFKMTPQGTLTTLYNFPDDLSNAHPNAGMIQGKDGNFYGTATQGGVHFFGFVFKFTPAGDFSQIYSFSPSDGGYAPATGLTQGTDGNLYGATGSGGDNGYGVVFRLTLDGHLSTLHSFGGIDGFINGKGYALAYPNGALLQAADGNFYGTVLDGGAFGLGAIYKITPGGVLTPLYSFTTGRTDGSNPYSGLTLASDGNFYGTTWWGLNDIGSVFRMTPAGVLTNLHTFATNATDGSVPQYSELVQAGDGNLYGTTTKGGSNSKGTIFRVTMAGAFSIVYNFAVTDGEAPFGGLTRGPDGNLYGTTTKGGTDFRGTIFRFTVPTVAPPAGQAPAITGVVNGASFKAGGPITTGAWATVFGTNLVPSGDVRKWNTSTEIVNGKFPTTLDGTSVTVNGKPAAVAFISPAQVNIQPPDDVATGPVQVVVSTAAGGASAPFTATYAQFAPGLFPATSPYLAAQHSDGSYVGGYPGSTPAKPGEVIILWGSGFGPASPAVPAGQVFNGSNKLANTATVTIGGQTAAVDFAGVVGAGLVQLNVHVPSSISNGDAAVVVTIGGVSTQTTANMIAVHN